MFPRKKANIMLRNDKFSIVLVTFYVIVYVTILQFESTQYYGFIMLLFAPFLLCWMVYTILKFGKYTGTELGKEEFGYQDKSKKELGVF